MKINKSKQMAMLAIALLFSMGFAVIMLPLPVLSKVFVLLAFAWYWQQQCEQFIFLKKTFSIKSLDCDEDQRWIIETQNQKTYIAQLSPTSIATAHWMCLYFKNTSHKKNFRVLLSSDSLSKKDWSLLQLLVKFAKPLKH